MGFKYRDPKPSPSQGITAIERTKQYQERDIRTNQLKIVPPRVIVWANEEMYKIDSSMSSKNSDYFGNVGDNTLITRELDWVAQELSEWLGIPITYPEPPTVQD